MCYITLERIGVSTVTNPFDRSTRDTLVIGVDYHECGDIARWEI